MHRTSILKNSFRTICAILAGLILFGLVGTMDFQEEERQHAERLADALRELEARRSPAAANVDAESSIKKVAPSAPSAGGARVK